MKFLNLRKSLFSFGLLLCALGTNVLAQEANSASPTSSTTQAAEPEVVPASAQETIKPASDVQKPAQSPLQLRSKFRPQLGLGIGIIPGQGIWNDNHLGYFQAGILANIDIRAAERLGVRISLGGFGSDSVDDFGSTIAEFLASAELRVYLHSTKANPNRFYLAPFVLAGANYNYASFGGLDEFGQSMNYSYANYVGGAVGVGLEFRFGRHVALDIDVRGILQGLVSESEIPFENQATGQLLFDNIRGAVRFGVGGSFYF